MAVGIGSRGLEPGLVRRRLETKGLFGCLSSSHRQAPLEMGEAHLGLLLQSQAHLGRISPMGTPETRRAGPSKDIRMVWMGGMYGSTCAKSLAVCYGAGYTMGISGPSARCRQRLRAIIVGKPRVALCFI